MAGAGAGVRPVLIAVRAAAAGALVGFVAAVVLAWQLGPESSAHERPGHSVEAAEAFLDAWARHRNGTYVAEGTFTRSVGGDPALQSAVRTAQRPPDRLEIQPGSATGRQGGRRLACVTEDDGALTCRTGEPVGPYDDAVEREVAILREQVVGPDRLYDVTVDSDCFVLDLAVRYPAPPYGRQARYCFDGPTGALRLSRIDRGRVVDTVEMTTIRPDVTDADLGTGQG